jgi:hypothetical protein
MINVTPAEIEGWNRQVLPKKLLPDEHEHRA